jgi:hypothetical protein
VRALERGFKARNRKKIRLVGGISTVLVERTVRNQPRSYSLFPCVPSNPQWVPTIRLILAIHPVESPLIPSCPGAFVRESVRDSLPGKRSSPSRFVRQACARSRRCFSPLWPGGSGRCSEGTGVTARPSPSHQGVEKSELNASGLRTITEDAFWEVRHPAVVKLPPRARNGSLPPATAPSPPPTPPRTPPRPGQCG